MIVSREDPDRQTVMDDVRELEIVGSVERVLLERVGVDLPCRIDTGARTSALHVFDLVPEGRDHVAFVVRGERHGAVVDVDAIARVRRWAEVRSATGGLETRAFVALRIRLGHRTFPIEVGLTARNGMKYPMLLGRSAIEGRYLVDVARRYALPPCGGPT